MRTRSMPRIRPWLSWLLITALVTGLLPRGYMPGDGLWMELCTEVGPPRLVWVDFEDGAPEPVHHDEPCPWAGGSSPSLLQQIHLHLAESSPAAAVQARPALEPHDTLDRARARGPPSRLS